MERELQPPFCSSLLYVFLSLPDYLFFKIQFNFCVCVCVCEPFLTFLENFYFSLLSNFIYIFIVILTASCVYIYIYMCPSLTKLGIFKTTPEHLLYFKEAYCRNYISVFLFFLMPSVFIDFMCHSFSRFLTKSN